MAKRKAIARRVKQLLEDRGWTQKRLAGSAGMTEGQLSNFLKTAKNVEIDTILALERAFGEPIINVTGTNAKTKS